MCSLWYLVELSSHLPYLGMSTYSRVSVGAFGSLRGQSRTILGEERTFAKYLPYVFLSRLQETGANEICDGTSFTWKFSGGLNMDMDHVSVTARTRACCVDIDAMRID